MSSIHFGYKLYLFVTQHIFTLIIYMYDLLAQQNCNKINLRAIIFIYNPGIIYFRLGELELLSYM